MKRRMGNLGRGLMEGDSGEGGGLEEHGPDGDLTDENVNAHHQNTR